MSDMRAECLFIHDRSSLIRHSRLKHAVCQNIHVIDHDDMRRRIKGRMTDLELSLTGKWLKEHGIGQTTIRNFLDGMSSSTTTETLSKLAGPLKTTERWLIFGSDNPTLSDAVLHEMVDYAVSEIQPSMSIGQMRNAVASALREQLKLHLVVDGVQDSPDEETSPDKDAPPPAPTRKGGRGGSRSA